VHRAEALLNLMSNGSTDSSTESMTILAGRCDSVLEALAAVSPSDTARLRARLATLPPSPDEKATSPGDPSGDGSLAAIAWRDPASLPIELADGSREIRYWELHAGLTAAAACLAGLLVLILCLRFRAGIVRAVGRLPLDPSAMRVLALGSLWWTWLKFGAVGLLLMAASAVLQRQSRKQVAAEARSSPA
jgi:hypothetical protein